MKKILSRNLNSILFTYFHLLANYYLKKERKMSIVFYSIFGWLYLYHLFIYGFKKKKSA